VDQIPRVFGTTVCAIVLADALGRPAEAAVQGISDRDYDSYENVWRPYDVLLTKVLADQVTTTVSQCMAEHEWRRTPFYLGFAKRLDLVECMQAPLYGAGGGLAGAVYFARPSRYRRFSLDDIRRATVLAGYLSAGCARVSSDSFGGRAGQAVNLSKRERETVALVAQGRSNPEISDTLQIARETVKQTLRRVYRKLDVNGRAEMVARLAELGWF
jgi:DNA-binding CsgD family transcriptional regulator